MEDLSKLADTEQRLKPAREEMQALTAMAEFILPNFLLLSCGCSAGLLRSSVGGGASSAPRPQGMAVAGSPADQTLGAGGVKGTEEESEDCATNQDEQQ